jgi:hypothetical protein
MQYDFSSGFTTSSTEIYLFIGVIAFMILITIVSQIQRNRRKKNPNKRRKKKSTTPVLRPVNRRRADLITLNTKEREIVDHLSWFLKDPRRSDRLLEDDRLLVRAARQGIREGIVPELGVVRLFHRLDIDTSQLGKGVRTSQSIPAGSDVSISDGEMNMAVGTVLLSGETAMIVRLEKSRHKLDPGKTIEVLCNSPDGMYRFQSSVIARDNKQLSIRQSFRVENVQRRKYRRRRLERVCDIRIGGAARDATTTQTVDLSLGGAAVKNPHKKLMPAIPIEFVLDPNTTAPLVIPGMVVRVSQRNKIAHVQFSNVDEKTRHRLFRRILAASSATR